MTSGGIPSFTRVMHEHDDLTQDHLTERLGALAAAPVADDVRADHLHAMRVATPDAPVRGRFGRLAVAAAAIVGFAAGSTGLAMAGALPDQAQGVAHDVLSVVEVDVPDRPQNRGACVSAAAKAGDEVAKAACAKGKPDGVPGHANGNDNGKSKGADAPGRPAEAGPHPNADTSDCKGKPAWAAEKRKPTAGEREARQACSPDEGDAPKEQELEDQGLEDEQGRQDPAATPAQPAVPAEPPVEAADPPVAVPATPADPPAEPEGARPDDARPDDAGPPAEPGRRDDGTPAG